MAWKRRSRPCLAVPPADSPSTRNSSQRSGCLSEQSASLPGRPPPSSAPLRRVRSRALRAASRARAASMALLMIFRADRRVLLEVCAQTFVDEGLHHAGDVGVQLALGLAFELGLRQLHADHGHQTFAHVVAGEIFFYVFEQAHLLAGVIDGAGQRGAEAGEMRAAVDGVDVVGETENRFGVGVVVLQADLHGHAVALGFHVDGLVVQHLFAAVQVLDEFGDAAVVLEVGGLGIASLGVGGALVGERDQQAFVQEGELTQALRQRVVVIFGDGEECFCREGSELWFRASWSRPLSSACWWVRPWSRSAPR